MIQLHIVLPKHIKGILKAVQVLSLVQDFHQHIIYINFHISSNLWTKHMVNQLLTGFSRILQTEGNYLVTKQALTNDKGCLLFVCLIHPYLIIT